QSIEAAQLAVGLAGEKLVVEQVVPVLRLRVMLYQALERRKDRRAIIELQVARQQHLQDLLAGLRRSVGQLLRGGARVGIVLLEEIPARDQVADRLVRRGTRE